MFSPGPLQMVIFLVIALLLFGNRLPSVMRSLGRSVTEFKKGVNGIESEFNDAMETADKKSKEKDNTKEEE
ncbi:MAG: twin-arginine translocase TatA/TatE family subunit [Planctomycetia bacterium]|nr:twin-arginine translocase TatA/TatE family subunit [Planctomycetia bacterium]